MQSVWQLNGSRELILFFTGWAMDEKPTQHLQTQRDICTCFYYGMEEDFSVNAQRFLECGTPVPLWNFRGDSKAVQEYRTPKTLRVTESQYDRVILVAWSMGVWAAETLLDFQPDRAIAINGTPCPVDDLLGIPVDIAHATCQTLNAANMERFQRRVFRGATDLTLPVVDCEARGEELSRIIDAGAAKSHLRWDRALISSRDAIFPPENLRRYWEGRCKIRELDAPHYPFHLFTTWEEIIA